MLTKSNRITVACLSIVTVCLGIACVVLLYYAGQEAIDAFYTHQTYTDEKHRIYRKNPDDELIGRFFMKGWGFGFIYIFLGILGLLTGLFNNICTMVIEIVISVIFLVAASFIHSIGIVSIITFRILTDTGSIRYDPTFGDCVFESIDPASPGVLEKHVDERCISARKAVTYAIAALIVFLVAWIFQFSNILYTALVYQGNNIKKDTDDGRTTGINNNAISMSTTASQTLRPRPRPSTASSSSRRKPRDVRQEQDGATGYSGKPNDERTDDVNIETGSHGNNEIACPSSFNLGEVQGGYTNEGFDSDSNTLQLRDVVVQGVDVTEQNDFTKL